MALQIARNHHVFILESDGQLPSDNGNGILPDDISSTSSAKYSEIDAQVSRPVNHTTNAIGQAIKLI